jgi:hypothetical protein
MTFNDPRILDLTAFDGHDDARNVDGCGSEPPQLRLALDLQLDAMLLTLGAAAHAESGVDLVHRGDDRARGDDVARGDVPWRRWLVEDLELARMLAAVLLEWETAPVPGFGGGFAPTTVETSLENLVARYSSMETLLSGLLDRAHCGQAWRAAATESLSRCRARLDELHRHRRAVITERAAHTCGPASETSGELLERPGVSWSELG